MYTVHVFDNASCIEIFLMLLIIEDDWRHHQKHEKTYFKEDLALLIVFKHIGLLIKMFLNWLLLLMMLYVTLRLVGFGLLSTHFY